MLQIFSHQDILVVKVNKSHLWVSIKTSNWSQKHSEVWCQKVQSLMWLGLQSLAVSCQPPLLHIYPFYVTISCQQGNALCVTLLHIMSSTLAKALNDKGWCCSLSRDTCGARLTIFMQYFTFWCENISAFMQKRRLSVLMKTFKSHAT